MLCYVTLVRGPYFIQIPFDLLKLAEQEGLVLSTPAAIKQRFATSVVLLQHP
jgi:hypothetical protein